MPNWKAWVWRPSGLIKMEGSTCAYNGGYLVKSREGGIEANFENQSSIVIVYY